MSRFSHAALGAAGVAAALLLVIAGTIPTREVGAPWQRTPSVPVGLGTPFPAVAPEPAVRFVAPVLHVTPNPIDFGMQVVLNVTASGDAPYGYNWSWLPPGCSNVNVSQITCTPTAIHPGGWVIRLNVTAYGPMHTGVSFLAKKLVINPAMQAVLAAGPLSGIAPLTVIFAVNVSGGGPPYGISWQFGDGNIGNSPNWTHIYIVPGNYSVEVWVNDTVGQSATQNTTITVLASPTKPPPTGFLGVKGNLGYLVLGASLLVLVLLLVYLAQRLRHRPRPSPPPYSTPEGPLPPG